MPSEKFTTQRVSNDYITLNNCGQQTLDAHDYDTVRDDGRVDFGLQFIESGQCIYEDNGIVNIAEEGSLLLHFPGVRQHYSFKKEDATHLMWAHFSGVCCKMLDDIKSDVTVHIKVSDIKEFKRAFERMISVYNVRKPYYETVCSGYLLSILGLVMQSATEQQRRLENHKNDRLDNVINYMNENFDQPIDLAKYSEMCFVSQSRFLHIFKDYTGYSPYKFHLKIRIERAMELIVYTSMSIDDVSSSVGFSDCSYFCRVFKKFTGHTPLHYRK